MGFRAIWTWVWILPFLFLSSLWSSERRGEGEKEISLTLEWNPWASYWLHCPCPMPVARGMPGADWLRSELPEPIMVEDSECLDWLLRWRLLQLGSHTEDLPAYRVPSRMTGCAHLPMWARGFLRSEEPERVSGTCDLTCVLCSCSLYLQPSVTSHSSPHLSPGFGDNPNCYSSEVRWVFYLLLGKTWILSPKKIKVL